LAAARAVLAAAIASGDAEAIASARDRVDALQQNLSAARRRLAAAAGSTAGIQD
jgi:hypothetical protein